MPSMGDKDDGNECIIRKSMGFKIESIIKVVIVFYCIVVCYCIVWYGIVLVIGRCDASFLRDSAYFAFTKTFLTLFRIQSVYEFILINLDVYIYIFISEANILSSNTKSIWY